MSNRWNIVPNTLMSSLRELPRDDQERVLADTFSAFEKSQRPDNRFVVAGLLVVLLLAGAIGGGIGGGLAVQRERCPEAVADASITTATVTVTTSISVPEATSPTPSPPEASPPEATSSTIPSFLTSCNSSQPYTPLNPSSQNSTYTINSTTLTYTLLCSQNLPGDPNPDALLTDIQQILFNDMPSIYACIDACAVYNYQIPSVEFSSSRGTNVSFGPETLCSAVSLGPGLKDRQASCLLKTKNKIGPRISGSRDDKFQSAVLNWPD